MTYLKVLWCIVDQVVFQCLKGVYLAEHSTNLGQWTRNSRNFNLKLQILWIVTAKKESPSLGILAQLDDSENTELGLGQKL